MKTIKMCMVIILFVSIVIVVQAQESSFQGTWIGERDAWVDRSSFRIEISGNNWIQYFNNVIEAAGTIRFSPGRAELLLADGRLAWDLRLLAPGRIEQPVSMWSGLYRFRHSHFLGEERRRQAELHLRNGETNRAITYFTDAIQLNPNDAIAFNGRGIAKSMLQFTWGIEYEGVGFLAIADFTEAIRINPNYAEAYFNRGSLRLRGGIGRVFNAILLEEIGDIDLAIKDFNKAILLNPRYAEAFFERGTAYHWQGDFDRAVADFEIGLRLDPNNALVDMFNIEAARRGEFGEL